MAVGINRGNLGYRPISIRTTPCSNYLMCAGRGACISEKRFLLEARSARTARAYPAQPCEVVLHPGKVAHMIEFGVYIGETFAFLQRSDGFDHFCADRLHRYLKLLRRRPYSDLHWMQSPARCRCSRYLVGAPVSH